jgi:HAD superfamily hydrolase (TIGR01490 family)
MAEFAHIAFYDLDHTILSGNSATYLVEEARQRGIMTPKQYRHALYLSILYKMNLGDPTRMINRMLSWLGGLRAETVTKLCREVFEEILIQQIRPEIVEAIEGHTRNRGKNVLLSSATKPICEPITAHLDLEDMICTLLHEENGVLTGSTEGKLVYGKEKKIRMLDYCENNGFDPRTAYYYGDSVTDQYVMEAVGYPVAVAPDKKLLKIARAKRWEILTLDRP